MTKEYKRYRIGDIFDDLTLIAKTNKRGHNGDVIYLCRCICGNEVYRSTGTINNSIKRGHHISCGCYVYKLNKARNIGNLYRSDKKRIDKSREALGQYKGTTMQGIYLRKKINKNNNTGVRGVSYVPKLNKYRVRIMLSRKEYALGMFDKLEDAVKVRKRAEQELYDPLIDEWKEINKNG